jgi:hypothetical protein
MNMAVRNKIRILSVGDRELIRSGMASLLCLET